MSENDKSYPADRKYTREHEWVTVEGNIGTVGITHYAQSELGDVVFVDLPEKGRALVAGEELGTVESVKAVSEIYAPVSGTVLEVNENLRDAPEKLNADPFAEGWLVRLEIKKPEELTGLLTSESYKRHVEEGDH